jgi:hypothetical protein
MFDGKTQILENKSRKNNPRKAAQGKTRAAQGFVLMGPSWSLAAQGGAR